MVMSTFRNPSKDKLKGASILKEQVRLQSKCKHKEQGKPVGIYGSMRDEIPGGGHTAKTIEQAREAMGIDWMIWGELVEAIPPMYTLHLGNQLREQLT